MIASIIYVFLWLGEFPVGSIFLQLSYTISLGRRKHYSLLKTSHCVMKNYMPVGKYYISTHISKNTLFRHVGIITRTGSSKAMYPPQKIAKKTA